MKLLSQSVGDSCMAGADYRVTGCGARIYPYYMYWFCRTLSFWRDTLLIVDIVGRGNVDGSGMGE